MLFLGALRKMIHGKKPETENLATLLFNRSRPTAFIWQIIMQPRMHMSLIFTVA